MASLVNLKRRIRIARNIAKTTRAMQMVAASKVKRAQESAVKGRPYAEKLFSVVRNLAKGTENDERHPLLIKREKGKILLIVFSPDKGLCGSLVTNIIREFYSSNFADTKETLYLTVGKKLSRTINRLGGNLLADFPTGTALPTFEQIPPLAKIIIEGFLKNDFREVFVLYAKFLSLFRQEAALTKLLPIELSAQESSPEAVLIDYLFEPNTREVLETLLPHYLESELYHFLLEAYASEQAARMLAMQNATENANEIINFLTLEYNKARQEKITSEILDVARAANVLMTI